MDKTGRVVEILDRDGQQFARIVIAPNTVVEVPAADLTLGDTVAVDTVPSSDPRATDAAVPTSWRDYGHVLRVAFVFAVAITGFIFLRARMIPPDFGKYGHYRAGAIAEIAAKVPVHAGQQECITCHEDQQKERLGSKHERVSCEACHGPLGAHARFDTDVAPIRPSTRAVCLPCHSSRLGMPATFQKVNIKEHSESGPCTECHKAHSGKVF